MTPTLSVLMAEMRSMQIGLAHSLSRYKLKFSPDKVDTMIVQAIGLLDDLDKELNTYAMRLKEWYARAVARAPMPPVPSPPSPPPSLEALRRRNVRHTP